MTTPPTTLHDDQFTTEQICDGLAVAIAAREFNIAVSLLKLLAVRDPAAAQQVLDALNGKITLTLELGAHHV